jgi:hypothetical protein
VVKMIFLEVKMISLEVKIIFFGSNNDKDIKIQLENLKVIPDNSNKSFRQEAILFKSSD